MLFEPRHAGALKNRSMNEDVRASGSGEEAEVLAIGFHRGTEEAGKMHRPHDLLDRNGSEAFPGGRNHRAFHFGAGFSGHSGSFPDDISVNQNVPELQDVMSFDKETKISFIRTSSSLRSSLGASGDSFRRGKAK
jgi:hypothetical protein